MGLVKRGRVLQSDEGWDGTGEREGGQLQGDVDGHGDRVGGSE